MGNILKVEKQLQIQTLTQLKWSDRKIGKELQVDRGTVSKYRKGFKNRPKVPTDFEVTPGTQSPNIFPYRDFIKIKYLQHLSAQRIYQDLVEERGYSGSYDSVKRYVRKLKKKVKRYSERLHHPPGREAQVDFGKSPCFVRVNGRYRRVWLFKMTLCCSKHSYEELVERQDLETFIRCHERGFKFFNGVPEIVTLDNIKSGVLRACLYDPVLNQTYLSFAAHWKFAANPCIPGKPEHKGVVERDIGYTKDNGLKRRRFESLEDGNCFLRHWNRRWAQTRIHGSTKRQVWSMFNEIERPLLNPLTERCFEYFKIGTRKVDVSGLIEVQSCFYAVPPQYVGERLVVHFNQQWIKIIKDGQVIITHRRLKQRGKVSQPLSCLPSWKHPDLESQERYYLKKARAAGPCVHRVVFELLSSENPMSIRRVRGMMRLLREYGPEITEKASSQALRSHNLRYQTVLHLCQQIKNGLDLSFKGLTQEHELMRPLSDYENLLV